MSNINATTSASRALFQHVPVDNVSSDEAKKELNVPAEITDLPVNEESETNLKALRENLRDSRRNALNALTELKTAHNKNDNEQMAAEKASADGSRDEELQKEKERKGKESETRTSGQSTVKALTGGKPGQEPELMHTLEECIDNLEFSALQDENYGVKPNSQSDVELQKDIQKLIEEMEKNFRDPFMSAAEKMTEYYKLVATLREIVSKAVSNKDDKVVIKYKEMFSQFDLMLNKVQLIGLYPESGTVSKAEAEAWALKMGVGVIQEFPAGSGMFRVAVDTSGLDSFIKAAKTSLDDGGGNGDDVYHVSQTVYNNFMATLDNFLQQENTKTNKITNQLEYYTKLLDNVRQTVNQFIKDMCKLAETILGNGR